MFRANRLFSVFTLLLFVNGCGAGSVAVGQSGTTATQGSSASTSAPIVAAGGTAAAGGSTTTPPGSTTPVVITDPNYLFSPYKDVTISANWNTSVISTAVTGTLTPLLQAAPEIPSVTWAFATGECGAENWGGIPGATLATANVATWAAANKTYILSTGGAAGAFTCGTDAGFSAFLDRYASTGLVGVDFDLEAGQTPAVIADLVARVKAAQANPKYANLRFSFTLATLGGSAAQSLGSMGVTVMAAIKAGGLEHYIINLMAMDYGSATATNCTLDTAGACQMGQSATQAAINLNTTYAVPFSQIELTPMIGGNDSAGETFTVDDVATVLAFAQAKKLAGLHIWSLDRDKDCAAGSASPTCNSYGSAGTLGFTHKFLGTSG
jgi:hypothetical protein